MDVTQTEAVPDDVLEQLEEKDQLIQTLTERLSEVAEQLDRAQRSGGDRSSRSGGASGEMQEQQRQLAENLSSMLELWEDVHPKNAFFRLEARLDHMRSLLESAFESGASPSTPPLNSVAAAKPEIPQPQKSQAKDNGDEPTASGWEAMKAQLLSGSPKPSAPESEPPASQEEDGADSAPPVNAAVVEPPDELPVDLGDNIALPVPVDFQTAERSDLEQAIEVRDQFIVALSRRLRSEQQRTRQATNWEELNNAPEDLRTQLQSLEADLQDRLRVAEVELSLERARLSRVQSRVEDMQRQVESQMRVRRSHGTADASSAPKAAEADQAASKSWFNNLRRK